MAFPELEKIFKNEFGEDFIHFSRLKFSQNSINEKTATFIAPNIFIANWMKTKFLKKIAEILQKNLNITPQILIIAEKNKNSIKNFKQILQKIESSLNPSLDFKSFVVGKSNEFAYKIAQTVAHGNADYNPVLFYGGTGLGKTHLLNAIGNIAKDVEKNVIYVTSEEFLNDYISKLHSKNMEKFREKYRNCDFLLIDDVQFFAGKQQIQEEFFHTFNELVAKKKQIILTTDKNTSQIIGLEKRLQSRFKGGVSAGIKPPELTTKILIIKKKCETNRIKIADDVIEFMAAKVGENIREIEGLIIRLNAHSTLLGIEITREIVQNALSDEKTQKNDVDTAQILNLVAHQMNIKPSEIKKSKKQYPTLARQIVIFLCRELLQNSMTTIAKEFDLKNASTINKAMSAIREKMARDKKLELKIDEIREQILKSGA